MSEPKCPKCGSSNLWDDNIYEGCNNCDYQSSDLYLVNKEDDSIITKVDD